MKKILVLGGLWLAFAASANAQNGDGYWKKLQKTHPETTFETLENTTPAVSQAPSGQASIDACRLSMVYAGNARDISDETINLMKGNGLKKSDIRKFKKEVLFAAGGKKMWLPVRKTLAEQLEIEVSKYESVLLYTTVLQDNDPQDQHVTLLVEDYQLD